MNKEDRKRLEEIEEKRRRREAGLSYGDECPDEDWLISQLKAEAAEVEQLKINLKDWKGLADRTATAIVEYGAMREKAEDRAETAEAERDKLAERVKRLEDLLFAYDEMDKPPCFVCGYNGPGYYQPDKHPCAERHHRLTGEVEKARAALEGKP